jgi:UDP-N-acetylglucosamine acyltransferase
MIAPNRIHPTAVIEGAVELADDVEIGALCYLRGPLIIGPGTRIWPHVIIGCEGEHRERGPVGVISIGAGVVIRELTVIQRGTGDRDTTIGDRCYVMDHCHIAHDVVLAEDVTLSPNVVLGGHTRVHRGATIGIGAVTHQRSTIGAYSMVGMGAVVTRDVPPFVTALGNPVRFQRWNAHGLKRLDIDESLLRVRGRGLGGGVEMASCHMEAAEHIERYRLDRTGRDRPEITLPDRARMVWRLSLVACGCP